MVLRCIDWTTPSRVHVKPVDPVGFDELAVTNGQLSSAPVIERAGAGTPTFTVEDTEFTKVHWVTVAFIWTVPLPVPVTTTEVPELPAGTVATLELDVDHAIVAPAGTPETVYVLVVPTQKFVVAVVEIPKVGAGREIGI